MVILEKDKNLKSINYIPLKKLANKSKLNPKQVEEMIIIPETNESEKRKQRKLMKPKAGSIKKSIQLINIQLDKSIF